MEETLLSELDTHRIPATACQVSSLKDLLSSTDSKTLEETLESLQEASKSADGRSHLASKEAVSHLLLLLSHSLSQNPPSITHLFSILKTLRNLCAGELLNQTSFIKSNGVETVDLAFRLVGFESINVVRIGLQLLGNVALAGEEHQSAVWDRFFPTGFEGLASVHKLEVCDPLCMILCVCCEGSERRWEDICGDQGLRIIAEIFRTASAVGFQEDWLPSLLSRLFFKEPYFSQLFLELRLTNASRNCNDLNCGDNLFTMEQASLLGLLSDILNQQTNNIVVSSCFVLAVFEILKKASGAVDSISRGQLGLPTGIPMIDVLGYSLNILRDVCAQDSPKDQNASSIATVGISEAEASTSIIESRLFLDLVTFLLCMLRELEPPEMIRKCRMPEENQGKVCPYLGYRRDIVSVIGNCSFRRKQVQDVIRQQNGILLIMQQCIVDENNPFLREWGIWAVRNLLEGNADNQLRVAELELQGSVDTPDISSLGLRVEVDQKTQRAKLVNIS